MKVYRFREDGVFDAEIEIDDGPFVPPYHTFEAPPAKVGFHAVMNNGWTLVEGDAPDYPLLSSAKPYEVAFSEFAENRNSLLAQTDWWAIRAAETSVPMTDEQLAYRNSLRTMDDTEGFDPFNPEWPVKPS